MNKKLAQSIRNEIDKKDKFTMNVPVNINSSFKQALSKLSFKERKHIHIRKNLFYPMLSIVKPVNNMQIIEYRKW
jgi:hypothetical protein